MSKPYRRYPPDPVARKWVWLIIALTMLMLVIALIDKTT